jgi:hypothetical protein
MASLRGEVRILRRLFLRFPLLLSGRIILQVMVGNYEEDHQWLQEVEPLVFLNTSIARSTYNRMAGLEFEGTCHDGRTRGST